jgi:hypothetical protein
MSKCPNCMFLENYNGQDAYYCSKHGNEIEPRLVFVLPTGSHNVPCIALVPLTRKNWPTSWLRALEIAVEKGFMGKDFADTIIMRY